MDRSMLLNLFIEEYSGDFFKNAPWTQHDDISTVVDELLDQHKTFAQEWVRKHYKNITPMVFSPADTIVQDLRGILKGTSISDLSTREAKGVQET